MEEIFYIEDLEQLKVFSDPFRVKLIWELADEPKTGKMLADQLGMAPSKMRYHLTELERVGLIKMVRTELKNGIQQKFYQPAAKSISLSRVTKLLNETDKKQYADHVKESVYMMLEETKKLVREAKLEKSKILQIASNATLK